MRTGQGPHAGTTISSAEITDGAIVNADCNASMALARTKLATDSLIRYQKPVSEVHRGSDGAMVTSTTGAANFALADLPTWGDPLVEIAGSAANSSTITSTLWFEFVVPSEFVAGGNSVLVVSARYAGAGTVHATNKTIDAEIYELSDIDTAGSDLVDDPEPSAQTLTGTWADYTFGFTDTAVAVGDRLMVLIRMVLQETAGTNLNSFIAAIELQLDVRG